MTSCEICGEDCAPDTQVEVGGVVLHVCEECKAADQRAIEVAWSKVGQPTRKFLLGVWKNDA